MASINTNAAANQARQALAASQKELATSRTRIATGKAIGSAKDNGAIHSIATLMSAERSGWNVANDSLARGQSLIATASAGLDAITDLLQKAREKAVAYSDTSLSAEAKASIRADIEALLGQVDRTAMLTEFDGKKPLAETTVAAPTPALPGDLAKYIGMRANDATFWSIVDGGSTAGRIDFYFDAYNDADELSIAQGSTLSPYNGTIRATTGAYVAGPNVLSLDYAPSAGRFLGFNWRPITWPSDIWQVTNVVFTPALPAANYEFVSSSRGDLEGVTAQPMTLNALGLATIDWDDAGSLLPSIDRALGKAVNAASYYGERASSFDRLIEQNGRLADALETGVGNLVDADLGKESAKLQAGQIKESLATKALAIANAAPQWILALFKG